MNPRPCSPAQAVARAQQLLVAPSNQVVGYELGTGDYRLSAQGDLPWTTSTDGLAGSDCAGFAMCWCYQLPRHRPGFNAGEWATVSDDINTDSAIEDAQHAGELFALVTTYPLVGDLLVYHTIPAFGGAGPWIGHVSIVIDDSRLRAWMGMSRANTWDTPRYDLLDVAQCCGPNGRRPAVIKTDGSIWAHHDQMWPTHKTVVLRPVP
jgi:hypothetical protein